MFDFIVSIIKTVGSAVGGAIISVGMMFGGSVEPAQEPIDQPHEEVVITQLADKGVSTTTDQSIKVEQNESVSDNQSSVIQGPAKPPVQVQQLPVVKQQVVTPKDFRASCKPNREVANFGDKVTFDIDITFENSSDYTFTWPDKYLLKEDHNEAIYEMRKEGDFSLSVIATRKNDGHSKNVTCEVAVEKEEEKEVVKYSDECLYAYSKYEPVKKAYDKLYEEIKYKDLLDEDTSEEYSELADLQYELWDYESEINYWCD